jgi:isochorismate pyruvate lyase
MSSVTTTPTGPRAVVHCDTMEEVRSHIDTLDARIMALIAERSGYVAQAARIKPTADKIVDVPRIEAIITRVRALALAQGAPESVAEATYRAMIGAFIEYERSEFENLRKGVV